MTNKDGYTTITGNRTPRNTQTETKISEPPPQDQTHDHGNMDETTDNHQHPAQKKPDSNDPQTGEKTPWDSG